MCVLELNLWIPRVLATYEAATRPAMVVMAALFALVAIVWDLSRGLLTTASSTWDVAFVAVFGGALSGSVLATVAWFVHASGHASTHDFPLPLPSLLAELARACALPLSRLHAPHHDPDPEVRGSLSSSVLELIATGIISCFPLVPVALIGIPLFFVHPASLLVFSSAYTTAHLINYHLQLTDVHRLHHEDPCTNFGPNCVDILFGTTDRVEDAWHMVPNVLLSVVVVAALAWLTRRRATSV